MENTEGVTAIIISIILPLVLGWLQTRRTRSQKDIDISTAWEKLTAPLMKRLEQQEILLAGQTKVINELEAAKDEQARQIHDLQNVKAEMQKSIDTLTMDNRTMRAQMEILVNGVWELEKQIEGVGQKPVFSWRNKTPPPE